MNKDLLNEKNIKIVLTYNSSNSINSYPVTVRFNDSKECVLSTPLPAYFEKPRPKTKAVLEVKTKQGVFKSDVVLNDCSTSLKEVTFFVKPSNVWNTTELRRNLRLNIELPLSIKYNDDYEISSTTTNISAYGFKFYSNEKLSEPYKTSVAKATINLPNGEIFTADIKYIRSDSADIYNEEPSLVYKFLNLSMSQTMTLNNFIKETYQMLAE